MGPVRALLREPLKRTAGPHRDGPAPVRFAATRATHGPGTRRVFARRTPSGVPTPTRRPARGN